MNTIESRDQIAASMRALGADREDARVFGQYRFVCRDANGCVKWVEEIKNIVTDVGARKMLDVVLGNVAAGAVVLGLKGSGTPAYSDTQSSHPGWSEVGGANAPAYTGNRQTPTFAAAAGSSGSGNRSKTTSTALTFTFTSGGTVAGAFINIGGSATKDNATGTLFSVGDFSTPRSVVASDQLQVDYTLNA